VPLTRQAKVAAQKLRPLRADLTSAGVPGRVTARVVFFAAEADVSGIGRSLDSAVLLLMVFLI
jgi:hypothetical protein